MAVDEATRARLSQALMAIVQGATPEELSGYLADGFPSTVAEALERPLERDEMSAHVDLLFCALHAPAVVASG